MTTKTYNFTTLISGVNKFKIYDNILNQEICTIERKNLKTYYNDSIIENIAIYISDLEDINYRLQKLMNRYFNNTISQVLYVAKTKYLLSEIEARFNHYFKAEDMPMVASIITNIADTTRQDDCVYDYFAEHCLQYIQNKTKTKNYFDSQNQNSFETAISNYTSYKKAL